MAVEEEAAPEAAGEAVGGSASAGPAETAGGAPSGGWAVVPQVATAHAQHGVLPKALPELRNNLIKHAAVGRLRLRPVLA